jgi:hypothetical protein
LIVPHLTAQSPLVYSIALESQDCKEKTIAISITIKNKSGNDVIIDKKGPFYRVDVKKYGERVENRVTTDGEILEIIGDGHDAKYFQLPPKGTFTDRRVLPLDSKFFENGRRYGLTLTYGQFLTAEYRSLRVWKGTVESNVLEFRL